MIHHLLVHLIHLIWLVESKWIIWPRKIHANSHRKIAETRQCTSWIPPGVDHSLDSAGALDLKFAVFGVSAQSMIRADVNALKSNPRRKNQFSEGEADLFWAKLRSKAFHKVSCVPKCKRFLAGRSFPSLFVASKVGNKNTSGEFSSFPFCRLKRSDPSDGITETRAWWYDSLVNLMNSFLFVLDPNNSRLFSCWKFWPCTWSDVQVSSSNWRTPLVGRVKMLSGFFLEQPPSVVYD